MKTTDDFITGIASKSYLSGKPYLVKFADGHTQPTGDWLRAHLAEAGRTNGERRFVGPANCPGRLRARPGSAVAPLTTGRSPHQRFPNVRTAHELRVMTFNLRVRTILDGHNIWDKRRDLVVERVRAFDADLLGTQEGLDSMETYLRQQLGDYTFRGVGRDDGKQRGEMCGVFFKTARFELLDGGYFWLSKTPEKPGSRGWAEIYPRMVDLGEAPAARRRCSLFTGSIRTSTPTALGARAIVEAAARSDRPHRRRHALHRHRRLQHRSRFHALPHAARSAADRGVFAARRFSRRASGRHARRRHGAFLHRLARRTAHGLDSRQRAFPDHRCRDRPHPRARRLPIGSLSGDRDATCARRQAEPADAAQEVARTWNRWRFTRQLRRRARRFQELRTAIDDVTFHRFVCVFVVGGTALLR